MQTWGFNQTYFKSKLKENSKNIEMWFSQCENEQHYKELFAFLYNLHADEILDVEIHSILGDINKYGFHAFIEQYRQFGHLGFFSRIVLIA